MSSYLDLTIEGAPPAPSCINDSKPVTVPFVRAQKGKEKLTMLTAYDYPTARLLDESGIDMLLIGDSVATVLYGEDNTLAVTMEDMLRHVKAVSRGTRRALVIADMPFMSYQVSIEQALTNAGRLLKEAGAHAIKLEGGEEMADTIRALTRIGIPVVAHIGLTPQSIRAEGAYRMYGKSPEEQQMLLDAARAVERAGAFCVVLECVKADVARDITQALAIPTIGIGSGTSCDGQVLVTQDLVGLTLGKVPKFVMPVASLKDDLRQAVQTYISRTKSIPAQATMEKMEIKPHASSH